MPMHGLSTFPTRDNQVRKRQGACRKQAPCLIDVLVGTRLRRDTSRLDQDAESVPDGGQQFLQLVKMDGGGMLIAQEFIKQLVTG